jgi:FtsH-binding integral membrane protein
MSQYLSQGAAVISLDADTRSRFINRTYAHLTGAIFAFTGIEIALFKSGMAETIFRATGGNWLLVLGAFVVVGWIASGVAHSAKSAGAQYAALGAYVLAEALIFVPLLYVAEHYAKGAIASAAVVTFAGFAGLTATVFITGRDFSFLGGIIKWVGIVALLAIFGGLIFGFHLGTWFSVAMVGLAGASILYTTSNVLHHYPEDRYVAASLELFSAVALMLWYVLRIFLMREE